MGGMAKRKKSVGAQGNAAAKFNLGVIYESGRGVAKDLKVAAAWYEKAAASGDLHARARRDACLARDEADATRGAADARRL